MALLAMIGWLSSGFLLLWALLIRPPRRRALRIGLPLLILGLSGLPLVAGGPALGWLRGAVGDLAIPTLFLLADAVRRRARADPLRSRTHRTLLLSAAGFAILFYPSGLGICPYDPYRLGYGSPALLAGVFGFAALLWWRRREGAALVVMAGVLAWRLQIGESTNLFDYLVDPFLAAFGLGFLAARLLRRLKDRARRSAGRPGSSGPP